MLLPTHLQSDPNNSGMQKINEERFLTVWYCAHCHPQHWAFLRWLMISISSISEETYLREFVEHVKRRRSNRFGFQIGRTMKSAVLMGRLKNVNIEHLCHQRDSYICVGLVWQVCGSIGSFCSWLACKLRCKKQTKHNMMTFPNHQICLVSQPQF